jgi:hypothetical protein
MRWIIAAAALLAAAPLAAEDVAIDSAVYRETADAHGLRQLDDPDEVPHGITHLRWRIEGGEGRLSYRAVVR